MSVVRFRPWAPDSLLNYLTIWDQDSRSENPGGPHGTVVVPTPHPPDFQQADSATSAVDERPHPTYVETTLPLNGRFDEGASPEADTSIQAGINWGLQAPRYAERSFSSRSVHSIARNCSGTAYLDGYGP